MDRSHPGAADGRGRREPAALRGVRVLAVDDYADARELLRVILESAEAEVDLAASAEEALERLDAFRPHLILTDLSMPGRDGYWLLGEVQRRPGARALPVVAFTAFGRQHPPDRLLGAGFAAHLYKPIDPLELCDTLRRVLDTFPR